MSNKVESGIAIYCRVAFADDFAIKAQEDMLRNYAEEQILDISGVYSDNGASGVILNRSAFQKMMSEIEHGRISCVIIKDFSRLHRNYIQLDECLREMRGKGVRIISVNDGYDSDAPISVPYSELAEMINRAYKKDHSEKVKTGIARSRQLKLAQTGDFSV